MEIRVILDGPRPADYNMAADDALLILHSHRLIPPTIRLWSFSTPSVALGRFSNISETVNLLEMKRRKVIAVRRFTGGGVTFNDSRGEADWSFVSAGNNTMEKYSEIFRAFHVAMYSLGIETELRNISDISISGKKVSGMSAAKARSSVLVHGTLLLDPDLGLMDKLLKGLPDGNGGHIRPSSIVATINGAAGRKVGVDEINSSILKGFSRFGTLRNGNWTQLELDLVARLRSKYNDESWTHAR